ncbi:MAG: molybdopterin molybdotransferase MoeA [Rhodovibrionaceae bacterium]|nr:molybdopterin molybdotransferase MoeA [Rhodovibrionaceae bacterium]
MAQLSDDCFAHGGTLMTVGDALERLKASTEPVTEVERVALFQALGRILREHVVAPANVPAHPNSAVDGYAVFFDDLDPERETRLPVTGRASAGHPLDRAAGRGEAIRIFTGARMPEGPDTVMMQEDCRREGDEVVLRPGIKRGANARAAGEDIAAGATVLSDGQRLRAQDLGQAAAVGRTDLLVSRPLKVAVFSTGDELREPGQALEPGCIYDSNRYTVTALLRGLGCAVTDLGILPDQPDVVTRALEEAAGGQDLIVTSGGVSVGEEDHVKHAVETLGAIHTWRLAIKPGRPIALGQVGRIPFVGLPGNPVAVMVTFLNVVRPLILRLMGGAELAPHHFKVRALFDHKKKKDRREWVRVRLIQDDAGVLAAAKFPRDGAGILSSMVESDGLVELPEEMTHLEAGSLVDFLPFSEVTP